MVGMRKSLRIRGSSVRKGTLGAFWVPCFLALVLLGNMSAAGDSQSLQSPAMAGGAQSSIGAVADRSALRAFADVPHGSSLVAVLRILSVEQQRVKNAPCSPPSRSERSQSSDNKDADRIDAISRHLSLKSSACCGLLLSIDSAI